LWLSCSIYEGGGVCLPRGEDKQRAGQAAQEQQTGTLDASARRRGSDGGGGGGGRGERCCGTVGNGDWRPGLAKVHSEHRPNIPRQAFPPSIPRCGPHPTQLSFCLSTEPYRSLTHLYIARTDCPTTRDNGLPGHTRYSPPTPLSYSAAHTKQAKWEQSAHARPLCRQKTPARLFLANSPPTSRSSI
jgi:hypothetical protein